MTLSEQKNKFVAENLGCWHEFVPVRKGSNLGDCSCGTVINIYRDELKDHPHHQNPDFADRDRIRLLELMMGREDWEIFKWQVGGVTTKGCTTLNYKKFDYIGIDYITTPGRLLDAAASWLGWREE